MEKLDEINCKILNLLQKDCRMSLTDISKKVNLSIDSVTKRIDKMIKEHIFYPKIQLRPRNFGFNNIIDVKIKLHNYTSRDMENFIAYLLEDPHVAEVLCVSGNWDISIVLLAKDVKDLNNISKRIRDKFSKIINEWAESLTTVAYKFEYYDMPKLMGYTSKSDEFEYHEFIKSLKKKNEK